ncbi:hypothetical protein BU25DRAFT_328258, partial [Macroventuria anomochaeta]
TSSKHSTSHSAKDSLELIPVGISTDSNVGKSASLLGTISSALKQQSQSATTEVNTCCPCVQSVIKRSASSELLKIDNLNNYMTACAEYNRGVEAEWTEDHLLAVIAKWRALDTEDEGK